MGDPQIRRRHAIRLLVALLLVLTASLSLAAEEIAPLPRHVRKQLQKAVERKEIRQETARQIMRDISQGCFASRMERLDPKKAIRLAQRYQDDADWMRRMGFDVSVARTVNLDQYFRLIEPRNFVRESMTTTHYQLGNQATYSVEMGPVHFTFQGAMVWTIVGNRVKTTTNDEGTFTSCAPTFNFLRAGSGWAPEVTINPVMLDYMPIGGSSPVYSQPSLKGYLTRQAVQTHVADEPDGCQDYTANYVYRYQYHAPDGNVIGFYQRPEEKPQTSTWGPNANFCTTRNPIIPREPDHYWSADGNAALDTSNKCRPVIRWSDGSVEEFGRAFNEDTPMVTSEDSERLIAEPYSLPTCSAEDWQRDLHITDRNGNVVTFTAGGMVDPQGRRTSLVTEDAGNGFTRLRAVELPSIGNAPPLRYTIEWKQLQVDFAQIWPDVKCHEQIDGLERPCSNSANPQDFSMPSPDLIDLVDFIVTPDGRRYTFEYGPWGNLTRVTEPGGAVREWIYGGAANLGYANAVTPLLNRPEEGRCLGTIWTDETVKMQARGITEERVYPNGLPANPALATACSAGSNDKCFYPTTYSFALRQLPMPYCQDGAGGTSYPGCSQLWKTSVLPDGTITKTGSSLAPLQASWWRDDTQVSLGVDLHGMPVGEETYSGGKLVSASYTADPDTGTIWIDGDVIPIRGSPYAVLGNSRPTRNVSIRDGVATTTNYFYGNWIDINPATDVTKRFSTEPTSVCTFGGIAAVSSDRVNDGCTLPSAGNPLLRTETSYLNYFDSSSLTGRILLDLQKETRVFGPNAAKTGFSTAALAAQTTAYDESPLASSGRPASALNSGVGAQRGNATTVQQQVDSARTVSVKTRYYDDGSIQSVTGPRGHLTTHTPDFSLCSASATLTEKQTNPLGHTITTVQDCVSGLPLRVTDANGRSLYTQYDHLGRAVETAGVGDELTALPTSGGLRPFTRDPASPAGAGSKPGDARVAAWTEYLDLGDPQRQRVVSHARDGSPDGRYSKVFNDGLGRTVQTRTEVDPAKTGGYAEIVSSSGFDGMNRVVTASMPCFANASNSVTAHCTAMAKKTTYDGLGRELSVLEPGNRLTSHQYGQENGRWLTTTTDRRRFTTKTFTDLLGRVVQIDRQSSLCAGGFCSTTMSYDAVGHMLSESDAGGNTIDYTYDMLGRRITMADPDMGKSLGKQWVYEYDEMGNLIAQTDAKGQRIELKYDPLNRITLKDLPPLGMSADDVTYFYDGQGPQPPDNPAPAVTSISPTSSAGNAGLALTVSGSNFTPGSVVRFNGQDRATTFVSANELTAVILASDVRVAGAYPVVVFTSAPGGGTSAAMTFTSGGGAPAITSMTPQSVQAGSAGFTLTVNGSNFVSGSVVTFNGQNRQTTFVSTQQLTAAIPASDVQSGGSRSVTVVNPGAGASAPVTFTVSNSSVAIAALAPPYGSAGSGGFTLTVHGSTFQPGISATFNGQPRQATYVGPQQMTVAILASDVQTAGSYPLTVTNPDGSGATATFTVLPPSNAAAFVSQSVPSTMTAGQTYLVTVTMKNSGGTTWTAAGNYELGSAGPQNNTTWGRTREQLSASVAPGAQHAFQFNVTAPATAGPANFQWQMVRANTEWFGEPSPSSSITVANPAPSMASISPASATKGGPAFTLTVNGSGFVSGAVVTFNGQNRTTTFVNAAQLTASIPATDLQSAGTYAVTAVNPAPGGGASAAATFTVSNPAPSISSIAPSGRIAGSGAFTLTVNGSNFVSGAVVAFNGAARPTTFVSAAQLTAAMPASDAQTTGTFAITVLNPAPGGGASNAATLTVSAAPTVTMTAPANGTAITTPADVTLNASTTGSVAKVEFFRGTTLVGTATTAPYSVVWTNAIPGTWVLTAKATAPDGTVVQSAGVTITVGSSTTVNATGVYNATADFSARQGQANWYYLDSNGAPMNWIAAEGIWQGAEYYNRLWQGAGHPGAAADAVRQWVAPVAGTIRITGNAADANVTCGNGATVSIRRGTQVLWQQSLDNVATVYPYDLTLAISAGEPLNFVINSRGDYFCDATNFNPTVAYVPQSSTARASSDFANSQGVANWYYLDSNGTPMNFVTAEGLWQGAEYYNRLWQTGGHPGAAADAVRQWKAPVAGTVRIRGNASDGNASCGNGVIVFIKKGTQILWQQTIENGNATGFAFDLTTTVAAGDPINFVINNRGGDWVCDGTNFDPAVVYTTTYRASTDFSSTQGQANWYYRTSSGALMTFSTSEGLWRGEEQYSLLWQTGGHPGPTLDTVRQWRVPLAGNIRVTGNAADGNGTCGNGVVVSIRRGTQVLWQQTLENGNATGFAFDLALHVQPGELLDFVVNSRGGDWVCDATTFDPVIQYVVPASYTASTGFSSIQGQGGWQYVDGSGAPMTFFPAEGMWRGPEQYLLLWSVGGHPGAGGDAVRQWRAPVTGTVRITGNASDGNANCGNGVIVSIRRGAQVLWQQAIDNANATGFAFDVTTAVSAGEAVSFVINNRGGDWVCDSTNFDPTVQYTPAW